MNNKILITQAQHLTIQANISLFKEKLLSATREEFELLFTLDLLRYHVIVVILKDDFKVRVNIPVDYFLSLGYIELNNFLIDSWNREFIIK